MAPAPMHEGETGSPIDSGRTGIGAWRSSRGWRRSTRKTQKRWSRLHRQSARSMESWTPTQGTQGGWRAAHHFPPQRYQRCAKPGAGPPRGTNELRSTATCFSVFRDLLRTPRETRRLDSSIPPHASHHAPGSVAFVDLSGPLWPSVVYKASIVPGASMSAVLRLSWRVDKRLFTTRYAKVRRAGDVVATRWGSSWREAWW